MTERAASEPVLLLDDVFSELDRRRSGALLRVLPSTQAIITTAVPLDELLAADAIYARP